MKLYTQSYYNPYFIDIKGKSYCIDSIHVFQNGKVIAQTNQGWFGSNNNCRELEIEGECVRKLKVDLNCHTAFVVSSGKKDWYSDSNRYELYIPAEYLELADAEYHKEMYNTCFVKVVRSTKYQCVVFEDRKFVDKNLYAITDKLKVIGEYLKGIHPYHLNEHDVIEKANEAIELAKEFEAEKELMTNLEIEPW